MSSSRTPHLARLTALVFLLASPPATISAQVAVGDTVRLSDARIEIARGTFVRADPDALVLRHLTTRDTVRVVATDFTRVERLAGRRRVGGAAIRRGLQAGALAGAAGGVASTMDNPGRNDVGGVAGNVVIGTLIGAFAGGTLGVLASGDRRESWESVDIWAAGRPALVAQIAPEVPRDSAPPPPDTVPVAPRPPVVQVVAPRARVPGVVAPLDTVRLFWRGNEWVAGTLVGMDGASFHVVPLRNVDTVRYARDSIDRGEVRRGERKRGWRSVGTGTLAGLGVGLGLVTLAVATADQSDEGIGIAVAIVYGLPAATLTGFVAGAIASQTYAERWLSFDIQTMRVGF